MNRHQKRTSRQMEIWNKQQLKNVIQEVEWLYKYYIYYSGRSTVIDFREFIESKSTQQLLIEYRKTQQRDE